MVNNMSFLNLQTHLTEEGVNDLSNEMEEKPDLLGNQAENKPNLLGNQAEKKPNLLGKEAAGKHEKSQTFKCDICFKVGRNPLSIFQ